MRSDGARKAFCEGRAADHRPLDGRGDPAAGFRVRELRSVLAAASLHSFNSRAERSLSGRPYRMTEHADCLLDTQFPHSEARRGDPNNI